VSDIVTSNYYADMPIFTYVMFVFDWLYVLEYYFSLLQSVAYFRHTPEMCRSSPISKFNLNIFPELGTQTPGQGREM
jgi:hypothetical protein